MIPKIQYYSNTCKNNNFTSSMISKRKNIARHSRKDIQKLNHSRNIFVQLKNIFFELFPKLDPEYKSIKFNA